MTTDAKPSAEISLLNLCRGAKEENSELLIAENLHFGQLLYYLQNIFRLVRAKRHLVIIALSFER